MVVIVEDDELLRKKKKEYSKKSNMKKKILALAKTAELGKEYELCDGILVSFTMPEGGDE